jgi:hypothetical protein
MIRTRVFLLGLIAAAACGGIDTDQSSRPQIVRLPNGALRVRGPDDGVWGAKPWRLTEERRIGRMEGEGPDLFGQPWAVEQDELGRIYVLDQQSKDVRVFAADGKHLRTIGRPGSGPGEFSNPFALAWDPAGNLWVVDIGHARYSVFDTAGQLKRELRRQVSGYSWPWPGRFDRKGLLYETNDRGTDTTWPIVAFRPEQELIATDTFRGAIQSGRFGDFWDLKNVSGIVGTAVGIPFTPTSRWALDRDARIWAGHSSAYSIALRELSGDTIMVIERAIQAVPVSNDDRAAFIATLPDHVRKHPNLDVSRIPATKPFFERLLPDPDGRLWVLRRAAGDNWQFDVFGEDGAFLGEVALPMEPSLLPPPLIKKDAILLVTRDSLDVPYIVRLRIVKP